MDRVLVDGLQRDYPQIFQDLWGNPRETCMTWGIDCDDGWHALIRNLCQEITVLDPGPNFKAAQIKEKFGGLRFYCSGLPVDPQKQKTISRLIQLAEQDSYKICETCGTRDGVTVEGSWIKTLCKPCRQRLHAEMSGIAQEEPTKTA